MRPVGDEITMIAEHFGLEDEVDDPTWDQVYDELRGDVVYQLGSRVREWCVTEPRHEAGE